MGKLHGKVAVITGAARGLGEATARLFITEGARVLLCDVLDDAGAALAAELGEAAAYQHLDVTQPSDWDVAVGRAGELFGRLDVLVNNAGIVRRGSLIGSSLDDYHATVAVNQTGVWLGIRAVAPAMRSSGGGSIINMSSAAAYNAASGLGAYGTTKWAVRGMTKMAASELGAFGIRVNSVHPGLMATDMMRVLGLEDGAAEWGRRMTPIGRAGTGDDVARIVVFLASDDSAYCTGSEYAVDGGLLIGRASSPDA